MDEHVDLGQLARAKFAHLGPEVSEKIGKFVRDIQNAYKDEIAKVVRGWMHYWQQQ